MGAAGRRQGAGAPVPPQAPSEAPRGRRHRVRKVARVAPAQREARYIVTGFRRGARMPKGMMEVPLYLGPVAATKRRDAEREAVRLFGVVYDVDVHDVREISKKWRKRIQRNEAASGFTRILDLYE
jgi:hypothetical protein